MRGRRKRGDKVSFGRVEDGESPFIKDKVIKVIFVV
jgi:hypothetical protein